MRINNDKRKENDNPNFIKIKKIFLKDPKKQSLKKETNTQNERKYLQKKHLTRDLFS